MSPSGEAAPQRVTGVTLGGDPRALQCLAQQRNNAVGVQPRLVQIAPTINTAKHRPAHQRRLGDPVDIGLHRTQLEQRRGLIRLPEVFPITLAARQIQGDAFAGVRLNMLDLQAAQLIAAKATPESQENQRTIAVRLEQRRAILLLARGLSLLLKPIDDPLQVLQLQRLGLFLLCRMQRANTLEDLAHHRRLGRVGETLTVMPLRQRRQAQLQGIDRQLRSVSNQIARNTVSGRRQKPAPLHFEMLDGCAIAAARVVAGGGLQIAIQIAHGLFSRWRTGLKMKMCILPCDIG